MPFDFTFESAHRILRSQFTGDLSDQSLMDYYITVKEHARKLKPQATLLEFKNVTSVNLSTAAIASLADSAPPLPAAAKPRIIVAPSDLIYGKCRAFEMLGDGKRSNLHIVRTMAEAYKLLGLTDPVFLTIPKAAAS